MSGGCMTLPSLARVREVFSYDANTGELKTLIDRPRSPAGRVAATRCAKGYVIVMLDGKQHKAHRIAYLLQTGKWPEGDIDHIDGIRHNNRWANLRDVDRKTNTRNQHTAHITNKSSGFLGVAKSRGRWRARIRTDHGRIGLGTFGTPEEAHAAYLQAQTVRNTKHHPVGV